MNSNTRKFFFHNTLFVHNIYERLNMAESDKGVAHLVNMSVVFTFSRIHTLSGQRI